MNRPIKGLHALGAAMEDTKIKDFGWLSITKDRVYYTFPREGLFALGEKYTYNFDRQGILRIQPVDRAGYSVIPHQTNPSLLVLQLSIRQEAQFGVWPGPRGRSPVVTLAREEDGWIRIDVGEPTHDPIQVSRSPKLPATPPVNPEPIQGFRERLRAAQDVLNSAKGELGDDMQMRVDDHGQLRVVVMLEI